MSKVIIKESELIKLIETAMDLDIYVQPVHYDKSNGNEEIIDSTEQIISRLKELLSSFNTGKKINYTLRDKIYHELDNLNKLYDEIKYDN
jgi:hypothetical protein